jgi:hypothetical protein
MNIDIATQEGYNIATALRGPDVHNSRISQALKWLFTARLRHWMGINRHVAYIGAATRQHVLRRDFTIRLYCWQNQGVEGLDGTYHFLAHTAAAFNAIARNEIFGWPPEVREEASHLAALATNCISLVNFYLAAIDPGRKWNGASEEALVATIREGYEKYCRQLF